MDTISKMQADVAARGRGWISIERLAEKAGCTITEVDRALAELEAAGWVDCLPVRKGHRRSLKVQATDRLRELYVKDYLPA